MSQDNIVPPGSDLSKEQARSVPSYAWIILVVMFLASVAAPLNQAKVPPLVPVLMESFQIDLSQAGMLMSVFAVTGLFLALPAGLILQKMGPKVTGSVALVSLIIGATLGALSTSMGLLLVSRVIEGIGMGLIAVVAPAVIAMWFPPEKQGTPMGIWATWVPAGNVIMLILAPALATSAGWQAVWWVGAGFALVTLVLYWLLMRMPPSLAADGPTVKEPLKLGKALAIQDIWLLALMFGCFTLVFMSFGTFFPTFLSKVRDYSLSQASFISSLSTLTILISAPAAGWLSDRIGSRRLVFSIPFLVIAVLMLFPFSVTGWQIFALMILLGLVTGAIPTAAFTAAPEVMGNPQLAGFGLAILSLGQNLGMFIGPILFGQLVETLDWTAAGYWLIPVCLLGFLIGWRVKVH